ncbi:hypothetical protein BKA63DRAFT_588494 [Paraphoma chrysanthemicola]|nr:hypothetical protein BKA63DRAFT_588494 [Paraphoma chrysanthemicola]
MASCSGPRLCMKCERRDWPIHKIVCKDYKRFVNTRPTAEHHNCIYFNPVENNPRFVWIRFEHDHNHPSAEDSSQYGLTVEKMRAGELDELDSSPVLNRHIGSHHIVMSLPKAKAMCTCCDGDIKTNDNLTKIDMELANFFRGPVLAFASRCGNHLDGNLAHLDLGPVDFIHIVDHLRLIYCDLEDCMRQLVDGSGIKAVCLNCKGDKFFLHRSSFEAVLEPNSSLQLESEITTLTADKIGLPLIVRKIPPAILWRDARRPCRVENENATMLNPPQQSSHTASLVLLRKDGNPLHPIHVYALLGYSTIALSDPSRSMRACVEADEYLENRTNEVSKAGFEELYAKMWHTCSVSSHFVPSPFEISDDFEARRF